MYNKNFMSTFDIIITNASLHIVISPVYTGSDRKLPV